MAFKLPDFTNTYCHFIGACGSVKSKSKKVLEILGSEPEPISARYKIGRHHGWITVILGGSKPKNHLHVEVLSDFLAKKNGLTKENRSIEEVQELLSSMVGMRVEVTVRGIFFMPVANLPDGSLIQPTYLEDDEVKIRALGMTLEIEDSDAPRFSWRLIRGNKLRIELATRLSGTIDEEYLDIFFTFLQSAFRGYVFAESPDAPDD